MISKRPGGLGSAAFGFFSGGLSLVASSRGRASMTRVVAFVSMHPAVMSVCGFGSGLVGCLTRKLGVLIVKLCYILEGCNEVGLTGLEIGSEDGVCCGESRNDSAIAGRSCGKVGDCLDCVLMVDSGVGGL